MERKHQSDEQGFDHSGHAAGSSDVFGGLTVERVMGKGVAARVREQDAFADLADALASSGRTAMAVTDADGALTGLATVNDVLRAFFEDVRPEHRMGAWLRSGRARAPGPRLARLVVRPGAPLAQVAETMVRNAAAGDCACHHVVVAEQDGQLSGVLSSHDLVGVLCRHDLWEHHPRYPDMFAPPGADEVIATTTVRDAMKHSGRVFTCPPTDTLKDALKVLLVTRQNCILVVDEAGVYGLVTPRDAAKAFADGISNCISIAEWLSTRDHSVESRMIGIDTLLVDAADRMTAEGVDHLVVVHPGGKEAVGVLSSLDVVFRVRPCPPVMRAVPLWKGPSIEEVLTQRPHLSEVCPQSTTLGAAAAMLSESGRTSMVVRLGSGSPEFGLLTENNMLRAYLDGWSRRFTVEDLLLTTEAQHTEMRQHMLVLPSVSLTEAATTMLRAAEPGHTCHHLVVSDVMGRWLGVFSALDVARALHSLPSELEVAKTGADMTTVDLIMKPSSTVPKCRPSDTLAEALAVLDMVSQNAALVVDEEGFHGLVTPRCALQALADGVPKDCPVAMWLQIQHPLDGSRQVALGTTLMDAASVMTARSLHHLLIVDVLGGNPVGVLSALDVARAVMSINDYCPFVSLGWLRLFGGPTSFSLQAPRGALETARKRAHGAEGAQGEATSQQVAA